MVYYTETNLIAIVVGAALLFLGRKASSKHETSYIIMAKMLRLLILLSVSDIAAYYFRGKSYIGVEVSNILYFIAMALGTYAWFLYILVKMGYTSDLKKTIILTGIPIVLLCIAIAQFLLQRGQRESLPPGHGCAGHLGRGMGLYACSTGDQCPLGHP